MDTEPDKQPDKEFAELVREAKAGLEHQPRWDKADVPLNCICIIGTVVLSVLFAPFSFFLIIFVLAPLGGGILFFDGSSANRQIGRSILLGCLFGFIYLAVVGSQW